MSAVSLWCGVSWPGVYTPFTCDRFCAGRAAATRDNAIAIRSFTESVLEAGVSRCCAANDTNRGKAFQGYPGNNNAPPVGGALPWPRELLLPLLAIRNGRRTNTRERIAGSVARRRRNRVDAPVALAGA